MGKARTGEEEENVKHGTVTTFGKLGYLSGTYSSRGVGILVGT